ncbi:YwiC-like family protein [Acaryochloris marina NIES-2412]|uniref:YwiC-like family protein n=1 Tax=Acaryochloris marina TaxID=155978 RepID=UPI00405866E8
MTTAIENAASPASSGRSTHAWHHPTISPEHGVYVVLLVSFLTGAVAAQHWTPATTLALVCAFAGFQAEHPLVLQIKQRRSWKPRFLFWGGLYGGIALGLGGYLALQVPILLWLYLGAISTFLIDAIAVFYHQQRSVANELLTFAAVCLAAPLAYTATSGTLTASVLGLWILNTLFFGSAIFTVKLRKPKTESWVPGLLYHAIASFVVLVLWYSSWLGTITALAFGVALFKLGLILLGQEWYRNTRIQNVAVLETLSAFVFLAIAAFSLLPAQLLTPA